MKELIEIQKELKAPKNQYNSFGKYKYRSCEDILEGVKPLLAKHGCILVINDSIQLVGDRFYVKATATIRNSEGESVAVDAYAREAEDKKGMDVSQVTGATSSYARKYALNGLFCIDDTQDADAQINNGAEKAQEKATEKEILEVNTLLASTKSDEVKFLKFIGVAKLEDMTKQQYRKAIAALKAKAGRAQAQKPQPAGAAA